MKTFYAYCRVSTEEQKKRYGIETQAKFLQQVYQSLPKTTTYQYQELREAKSGKNLTARTILLEALDKLTEGDIIAFYDTSRLGRDTVDVLSVLGQIKEKGATAYIELSPINMDVPEQELMQTIGAGIATYQRKVQKAKSKAGITIKKEQGEWVFRGDLMGYKVEGNKISIVESEAAILKYIFKSYAEGKSIHQITKELNQQGLSNRDGTPFYDASVRRFILKPIYMSYYKIEAAGGHKGQEKATVSKDKLVKSTLYPSIIEEELWWKCYNSYRKVTRKHSRQFEYRFSPFELTSMITCGHCLDLGKRVAYIHSHIKRHGLDTTWEVYVSRIHTKGCKQSIFTLRASPFEKLFRFCYLIYLSNWNEVESYYEQIHKERTKLTDAIDKQISAVISMIDSKHSELNDLLGKLIDLRSPSMKAGIDAKALMIEAEKANLETQLAKMQRERSEAVENEEQYLAWIDQSTESLLNEFYLSETPHRREIYKETIKSASIKDKLLTVVFINGKRIVAPLQVTKGRRMQTKFEIEVFYKNRKQGSVVYDSKADKHSFEGIKPFKAYEPIIGILNQLPISAIDKKE